MGERELFLAALELEDPRARAQYLDQVCSGDAALCARVEALVKSHEEGGSFLDEPAAYDVDATVAQTGPIDSSANTLGDTSATGSGRSPEPTLGQSEATLAHMPGPVAPNWATGDWTPDAVAPTETADGHAPSHALPRGTTVRYFGDYEVLKELGRGGMGVVYKARQVSLNRPVALKMIKAGVLADDAELRRFQNEAEAVALLDHPWIVPVYEVGEHDGQRYFSMKLVEGGNLADRLASFEDNPKAAAILLAEAAEAVHHAHMRGILHRDLKPANILVDTEGHPHVTDFGLAKRVEADIEMTASGAILGTPAYMSPEQAVGHRGSITTATDIYGLGAILYALLTSKAPFGGDSVMETLDAVRNQPPEPPTKCNAHTPRDLETICLKCLEKDPRRRYASAQALADDLHAWLDSRPITARRVRTAERAWLWCKRKPAIAVLAASVMMAVVVGTTAVIAVQARANGVLRDKNSELSLANDRVKQRFDLANEAIKLFQGEVGDDLVLKEEQFKPLRDKLLQSAAKFYGKLEQLLEGQPDPASRKMLGQAYYDLGELTTKIGDTAKALQIHRKGLAIRRERASSPTADVEAQLDVVRSLFGTVRPLYETDHLAESRTSLEEARDLLMKLPQSGPRSKDVRDLLSDVYGSIVIVRDKTGSTANAIEVERQVLALRQALADENPSDAELQRKLSVAHTMLGIRLSILSDTAGALAAHRQALAIRQRLGDETAADTQVLDDLAKSHNNIAYTLNALGKDAESLESYRHALRLWQKVARENPAVKHFRNNLGYVLNNYGWQLHRTGQTAESLAALRQALEIFLRLDEQNPEHPIYRGHLATSHMRIGLVLSQTGKPAEALESHRKALALQQKLAEDNPKNVFHQTQIAYTHLNLGILLLEINEPTKALDEQRQARAIFQRLADDNLKIPSYLNGLASGHTNVADALRILLRFDEAREGLEKAVAIRERLVNSNPTAIEYRGHLAYSLRRLGLTRLVLGDVAGSVTDARKTMALYEGMPTLSSPEQYELACCHAALAAAGGREGSGISAGEGETEADEAMTLLRKAVSAGYRNPNGLRRESSLDTLRNRPDFKLLMLDLAFPADPFAR